jgi:hypothetical protein
VLSYGVAVASRWQSPAFSGSTATTASDVAATAAYSNAVESLEYGFNTVTLTLKVCQCAAVVVVVVVPRSTWSRPRHVPAMC